MTHITRRQFVGSVAAGLGLTLVTPVSRVLGANDDIRVAVVGINGRGGSHISAFGDMKGVRVVAFCDVDRKVLGNKAQAFEKKYGRKVETYVDIRKLLENKDIDAISIATPNHWHSLATIWACQAGKDVYVEKPCSHNPFEGRKCLEAARKYQRIVQHGTQSRSSKSWARQVAAIASGKYGKLLVSKGMASKGSATGRWSIGFKPIEEPPKDLDYDIWLGPASQQPFHKNLVHYNWHWFWDFGNGEIGNQGVHEMDKARWAIPGATLPKSVISLGGRWVQTTEGHPPYTDQAQTPNCQLTIMDFGGPLLVFEVIGLVDKPGVDGTTRRGSVGNEFYLEAGTIKGGKFYPKGSTQAEDLAVGDVEIGEGGHFENFINAMRSRKIEDLNADIGVGYLSATCCHLGNISYRLGQQVAGSTKPEILGKHEVVAKSWETVLETVKGAIGLDVSQGTFQLGPMLTFDPKAEKFVGNKEADALLTRPYRKPFTVPEKV